MRKGPDSDRNPSVLKPSVSTESEFSRWKSSSHTPSPTEPTISARMLPVIRTLRTSRPATLAAVPSSRMTHASSAWPPVPSSQPKTLATKPAAKIETADIATTSVHM